MADPALHSREATYADLERVPDHLVAEILDGELIASPRPASRHARASSVLTGDLLPVFDGPAGGDRPGGWWILDEPELHLGRDVVVPDLAGWRRERMPAMADVAAFELPPDWACEVVSPSTGRIDRGRKRRIYARSGVMHLWLLDPIERVLEVFRLAGELWTLVATFEGDGRIRAEPFEAIELNMSRWFLPE